MSNKYDYDAIIIGAGISGLVCGCYLAKAGLKTLIVEKNNHVGGYCSSFEKNGFLFDYCAHAVSSLREGGILRKILRELQIEDNLRLKRNNPSDIIITSKYEIKIFHELHKTIAEFAKCFPKEEKNIRNFFYYINETPSFYLECKKVFYTFLSEYFKDINLISIISFVTESLLGTSVKKMSAMVACLMWKEFILDGGYIPSEGGMQAISDLFAKTFKEFGGTLLLSNSAEAIIVENNTSKGVRLKDDRIVCADNIISACDARHTYFELIGKKYLPESVRALINALIPSSSFNIVYLGVENYEKDSSKLMSNLYLYNDKSFLTSYMKKRDVSCNSFGVNIFTQAVGKKTKNEILEKSKTIAEKMLPDVSKYIVFEACATPKTLEGWTNNYNGAAYGWASTLNQFCNPDISQRSKIRNLFFSGHWSNQSGGISIVANCARNAFNFIFSGKYVFCRYKDIKIVNQKS